MKLKLKSVLKVAAVVAPVIIDAAPVVAKALKDRKAKKRARREAAE